METWGVHIIGKVHSSFFRVLCFVHCLSHSHLYPVLVSGVESPDMKLGRKYLASFQKLIRVSGQPVISLYFCQLRIWSAYIPGKKISNWSDILAFILFDWFLKNQLTNQPTNSNNKGAAQREGVCVWERVSKCVCGWMNECALHGKGTWCLLVLVVVELFCSMDGRVSDSMDSHVSDRLQWLSGFCEPLLPHYKWHTGLKNVWHDHRLIL